MRVLHIISSLDPALGGPAAAILPMAGALVKFGGLEVTVAGALSESLRSQIEVPAGVELVAHAIPGRDSLLRKREVSPRFVAWLVRAADRYDLVHTHGIFTVATAAADAMRRFGRSPFVMRPCGALDEWSLGQGSRLKKPFLEFITRPALRAASFVHCTSNSEADAVLRLEPSAEVQVIPHGLDLDAFRLKETGKRARPFVLFLGRLHHKKGLDLLAHAFNLIARDHPELELVVAGPDEGMQSTVERLAEAGGVRSRVRIVGPVYGEEKVRLMSQASIFVLPSHQENFGISAVEAAACGAPLVVSTGVAIHGEVTASAAGLVAPLDAQSLAAAMHKVLGNREEYARGARRFASTYSLERTATRLTSLYERAVASTRM